MAGAWNSRVRRYLHPVTRVRCWGCPGTRPRGRGELGPVAGGRRGRPARPHTVYFILFSLFLFIVLPITVPRTAHVFRCKHMDYSSSCCRLFFSVRVFCTRTCHVVKSKLKSLMQTLKVLYSMESCTRLAPAPRHEAPSSPTWSAPHHASTWCPCPTFAWTCWCNCSCSCDTPCLQARTRNSAS